MKNIQHIWTALQIAVMVAVALTVLSPIAPPFQPIPGRDQGVYLYVGQQILEGKIPYRDVWDHKGPLGFYINALGLLLWDGSIWGVWILEALFLCAAALAGFFAMRQAFNPPIAFSGSIMWLTSLCAVLDGGNRVEEYSLLFEFAAVYFYLRSEKENRNDWFELLIGSAAAFSFALRPNNIGVFVSIGLAMILCALIYKKGISHTLKRIAVILLGGAIVVGAIAAYFTLNHSLKQLFSAVFVYNYYYTQSIPFQPNVLAKGYVILTFLMQIGALGLIGVANRLRLYREQEDDQFHIAIFLLFAIPLQGYLSLMSGRHYLHYYIAWLPILSLLACFGMFLVIHLLEKIFHAFRHKTIFNHAVSCGLVFTFCLTPIMNRLPSLAYLANRTVSARSLPAADYSGMKYGEPARYILKNTGADDYVLIWGNEAAYNFLTGRRSPSRFVYTYPFGMGGYISRNMVDELRMAIIKNKPMIIDATAKDRALRRIRSKIWGDMPMVQGLIKYIEDNYIMIDRIGPDNWPVLIYRGPQ